MEEGWGLGDWGMGWGRVGSKWQVGGHDNLTRERKIALLQSLNDKVAVHGRIGGSLEGGKRENFPQSKMSVFWSFVLCAAAGLGAFKQQYTVDPGHVTREM